MNKHWNRKAVRVEEIDFIETPWGAHYSLYEDNDGRFFYDADDDTDTIIKADAETAQEALAELIAYVKESFTTCQA